VQGYRVRSRSTPVRRYQVPLQEVRSPHTQSVGGAVRFGPEVLAAASDNDPTNVGTALLVGAQTGYQLSWVALLVAPILAVILTIAAHVGIVAGDDLQSLVRKHYGLSTARLLLTCVLVINLVTMAADLQAGAAGLGILAGTGSSWFVVPLGLALVALLLAGRYNEVMRVMRYVLVGFLAFGAAAVFAKPDWLQVLRSTVVPALSMRPAELAGALALVGTTVTPYVYLWETIAVGVEAPSRTGRAATDLRASRVGAVIGAIATAVILWSILITSAATLGVLHKAVSPVQVAAQSLRPLAGSAATDIFAVGLVTSAIIALPVLMATTAHVIGTEFDWRRGLSHDVKHAGGFYAALAASIALAAAVDLAGVPLLDMLFAASVISGLGTPFGLVLLIRLGRNRTVMGNQTISVPLAAVGWLMTALIGILGAVYILVGLLGIN
jgi:Mn2+/Fe2+ NRAMP family transporter